MGRKRKARRVPLGQPLPESTDDDAVITTADIERAKIAWRKYSPEESRDLLDAEIAQGDEFS